MSDKNDRTLERTAPPRPEPRLAPETEPNVEDAVLVDDRYRLVRPIGEGGMGQVWSAWDAVLECRVAIKFLTPRGNKEQRDEQRRRFDREARMMIHLKGRNVLGIRDRGETADGRLYIVMELLEGESLDARLKARGRLTLPEVIEIIDRVSEALREAHGLGIVHRDLKPGNIFLQQLAGGEEQLRVLDFGIAKVLTSSTQQDGPQLTGKGEIVGTLPYMAPEQFDGTPSPQTDLYALGVIAYECLSGERPFKGDPHQLIAQHVVRTGSRPLPPHVEAPEEVRALISSLLEREPTARPSSAKALSEEVEKIRLSLRGLEHAQPEETSPRPKSKGARIVIGAAVLAGLVSGFGLLLASSSSELAEPVRPALPRPEWLPLLPEPVGGNVYTSIRQGELDMALDQVVNTLPIEPTPNLHLARLVLEQRTAPHACARRVKSWHERQAFCESASCEDPLSRAQAVFADLEERCRQTVQVDGAPQGSSFEISAHNGRSVHLEQAEIDLQSDREARLFAGRYTLSVRAAQCEEKRIDFSIEALGSDTYRVDAELECEARGLRTPRTVSSGVPPVRFEVRATHFGATNQTVAARARKAATDCGRARALKLIVRRVGHTARPIAISGGGSAFARCMLRKVEHFPLPPSKGLIEIVMTGGD